MKPILKSPAVILTAIALGVALLLSLTNAITADSIEENKRIKADKLRAEVLPAAVFIVQTSPDGIEYAAGTDGQGNPAGYVFTISVPGYGGPIEVMVGIGTRGLVTGVTVLEMTETPGLGMKAGDRAFLDGFTGASGSLSAVKHKPGEREIEAITGATVTSNAVTDAVNQAIELYKEVAR
ncbi:MAG: RnfABCDGE type electron transport complex subunit G [Oscillospiraceae bacterium]|nr:RnfABCDGE type electron transport complex subunit G [Oscillospiraceae bacterium]